MNCTLRLLGTGLTDFCYPKPLSLGMSKFEEHELRCSPDLSTDIERADRAIERLRSNSRQ